MGGLSKALSYGTPGEFDLVDSQSVCRRCAPYKRDLLNASQLFGVSLVRRIFNITSGYPVFTGLVTLYISLRSLNTCAFRGLGETERRDEVVCVFVHGILVRFSRVIP